MADSECSTWQEMPHTRRCKYAARISATVDYGCIPRCGQHQGQQKQMLAWGKPAGKLRLHMGGFPQSTPGFQPAAAFCLPVLPLILTDGQSCYPLGFPCVPAK